ncbi:MAG: hypothetical protein IJJ45_00345 [Clostridia bacterium]|nr:hypothetical protein [Clostridia bacterium]
MSQYHRSRASRRARQLRARRRRLMIIAAAAVVAAAVTAALLLSAGRGRRAADDARQPAPASTASSTAPAEILETATPSPSPAPTAQPIATPRPEGLPDRVSFYRPKGKSYSPRVRMGDTYAAKWKKGEDIGSFEVIASDLEELPGDFFGDIFGKAWTAFPASGGCRIGYTLRYTLDDGSEIKYTMLSPQHIRHTEYIECWLYDDYHREPHQFYSHIKKMKSDTLMTSIKLTCGSQIKRVQDIWLTAFICASLDEFDADRNYTGDVSCTIHIIRK